MGDKLIEIYKLLFEGLGPQHWWPGESRFEIIVGAILTQNTNWANVEKAIANLKAADCLNPKGLRGMDVVALGELILPAGYYRVKARRLKNFLKWLFDNYDGKPTKLEGVGTRQLRTELLSISGIGPETADSILLYALDRPVFVVDAYTARIAVRHGLIEANAGYEQLQGLFESGLPQDAQLFNEFHALLVKVGKEFCKPRAKCSCCPLENLPHTLGRDEFY